MRARLTEKLLSAKPGAIIYLTKEEWRFMMENPPRDPLLVEREKTHGSFSNVAQLAQNIKMTMRNSNRRINTAQEEALDLIATKIARIICGNPNEKDHWKDISGYALLGMEACD